MQIILTKEQVKKKHLRTAFHGCDNCYRYDKDSKKKTEEVEALKLHLGSMKLGNSVGYSLEATELPKIEPYAVVELEEPVYAPYAERKFPGISGEDYLVVYPPCSKQNMQAVKVPVLVLTYQTAG